MARSFLLAGVAVAALLIPLPLPGEALAQDKGSPPLLDRHGDALPQGAFARLGTVRLRHGADGCQIAYAPDGKVIASAGGGLIQFWDAQSGKEVRRLVTKPGEVKLLAFSPDGKLLTDKQLPHRQFGNQRTAAVAVSSDGKLVASSAVDGPIRVWEAASEKILHEIDTGQAAARSLAFLPDNTALAAAFGDASPLVWDLTSGKQIRAFGSSGECVAVAPNGKALAIHCGSHVRRWDLTTGQELSRIPGVGPGNSALCFSPDSSVLAIAGMGVIRLWDMAKDQDLLSQQGSTAPLIGLSFLDGDKELATWGHDGKLRVWDRSGKVLREAGVKHLAPFWNAISKDGKLLATWENEQPLRLWDARTGRVLRELRGPEQFAGPVHFTSDGKILNSCFMSKFLRIWDAATGKELPSIKDNGFSALTSSPDGKLLAWFDNQGRVCIWDKQTDEPLLRLRLGGQRAPIFVAFAPDSASIWAGFQAGYQGTRALVSRWDLREGKELQRVQMPADVQPHYYALSPDGRTVAVAGNTPETPTTSARPALLLVELSTSQVRRHLQTDGTVSGLAYAGDHTLASSHGATVLLWEGARPVAGQLDRAELDADAVKERWSALGGDGPRAFDAVCDLVRSPRAAAAWLEKHLPPMRPADPQRMAQLLRDLGSDKFPVREAANKALQDLGEAAIPGLRAALAKRLDLETEQRIWRVLHGLDDLVQPQRLREVRAVEVLEHLATPEGRRLLKALATGMDEARLTQEARAALARLTD